MDDRVRFMMLDLNDPKTYEDLHSSEIASEVHAACHLMEEGHCDYEVSVETNLTEELIKHVRYGSVFEEISDDYYFPQVFGRSDMIRRVSALIIEEDVSTHVIRMTTGMSTPFIEWIRKHYC